MERIFIVNSKGSKRTARFFKRHHPSLSSAFPTAEFLTVDASILQGLESYNEYSQLVLIGDDSFFHQALNQIHGPLLQKDGKQHYAFLPDSKESSIAASLELPHSIKSQIELIQASPTIPFDLVRCHCISKKGFPCEQLILNDALIRLPHLKMPLILKTIFQWFRSYSGLLGERTPTKITLFEQGKKRYEGNYLCAILLLGNKITGGPRLTQKKRFLSNRFQYYQLNSNDLMNYTASLPQLFNDDKSENTNLLKYQFSDMELRGLGEENRIIADGVLIGRLPASFTLLPKALLVVSPMNPVRQLKPKAATIKKRTHPIGNLSQSPKRLPPSQ